MIRKIIGEIDPEADFHEYASFDGRRSSVDSFRDSGNPEKGKVYTGVVFKNQGVYLNAACSIDQKTFFSLEPDGWTPKKHVSYRVRLGDKVLESRTRGHLGRWKCTAVDETKDLKNHKNKAVRVKL